MSWLSLIVLWFIIFLFVELGIYLCKSIREYLTSKRVKDTSDYRSFDRGEIVWYGGSKCRVKGYTWHSDTLDNTLTLDLGYGGTVKLDSRGVKKIERVYAEISND